MALVEGLPSQISHWGYWIEADGTFTPVGTHGHYSVYPPGFDTLATGRIRVTSVDLEAVHRVSTQTLIFTASFLTKFVTKAALQSAIDLVSAQDFDSFDIAGLVYESDEQLMAGAAGNPDDYLDHRSRRDLKTARHAIACLRSFT